MWFDLMWWNIYHSFTILFSALLLFFSLLFLSLTLFSLPFRLLFFSSPFLFIYLLCINFTQFAFDRYTFLSDMTIGRYHFSFVVLSFLPIISSHSPSFLIFFTFFLTFYFFFYRNAYHTLFVARISFDTTEKKLRREFEQYGPVRTVKMITDKNDKARCTTLPLTHWYLISNILTFSYLTHLTWPQNLT